MNEKNLYLALSGIIQSIRKEVIIWRIDGSVNLFIQGIPIKPADLDIATNREGFQKFEKSLARYNFKKEFKPEKNLFVLKGIIAEVPIEILQYEEKDKKAMFNKIKSMFWSKLYLPLLPLEDAKEFYSLIDREEKVKLIEDFIEKNKKANKP